VDLKRSKAFIRVLSGALLVLTMQTSIVDANSYDDPVEHPAIPLLDEAGAHVLNSGKPYSPKMSCGSGGGCHDYDKITHAYHFEMGRDEASDTFGASVGLPQLVSPGYFGGYACMGGNRPRILSKKTNSSEGSFLDYGSAGIVQACTGCHAGGGWMEKDREGIRYDERNVASIPHLDGDYYNRGTDENNPQRHALGDDVIGRWDWKKSGVVEADCMICHIDYSNMKKFAASGAVGATDGSDGSDSAYDFWRGLRRTELVGEGFFREAATAMLEFYDIEPTSDQGKQLVSFSRSFQASKEGKDDGYDLQLNDESKPQITWNPEAFDENMKAHIPMMRFPSNEACMTCHRTSNSRRGFYGFGDDATLTLGDDGVIEEDYKDDVHKGKTWTADNGEVRQIENCNTCHSSNYLKPAYANVDLSPDHQLLKGNSDMDVRNDLDYDPNAKSCELCHDQAVNKVIPSGHDSMLSAHEELWRANGDMAGYGENTLSKITQTHLDVISCQTCHITEKKSRGRPIQIMYRYRQAEDGKKKIIPYNPRIRNYWKDRNSDRVLSNGELSAVFEARSDTQGHLTGFIVHPMTGAELATVTASHGHHGTSFGSPQSYDDYIALKQAYDALLVSRGYANADVQQIWIESNEYLMSHNVQPSPSSMPCADCHERKQSGAFSALISQTGVLSSSKVKTVTTLPDKRLVDDGVVVLGEDYFRIDATGVVTENIDDILYTTKIDPFMTALKASSATANNGEFKQLTMQEVLVEVGLSEAGDESSSRSNQLTDQAFLYDTHQGDSALKASAIVATSYGTSDILFPSYRVQASVYNELLANVIATLQQVIPGGEVSSSIHWFNIIDQNNRPVVSFADKFYLKLPYTGQATDVGQVSLVYSSDGSELSRINSEDILLVQPHSELIPGYIVIQTDRLGYFVALDL